tara:strand:+ start:83 stop:640 length:558 start_codon:yes stop_codon:yes gene_type:complete
MRWIRATKVSPRMATWSDHPHNISPRPQSLIYYTAVTATIDRYHLIDTGTARTQQVANSSQVAQSLFTNTANKQNVRNGADTGAVQRMCHIKQQHQPASVIRNTWSVETVALPAHCHIRLKRKHCIEVRYDGYRLPASPSWSPSNHIPHCINGHISEDHFPEQRSKLLGTLRLAKGWRRDFSQLN